MPRTKQYADVNERMTAYRARKKAAAQEAERIRIHELRIRQDEDRRQREARSEISLVAWAKCRADLRREPKDWVEVVEWLFSR